MLLSWRIFSGSIPSKLCYIVKNATNYEICEMTLRRDDQDAFSLFVGSFEMSERWCVTIGEGRFEKTSFLRIMATILNAIGLVAPSSELVSVFKTARGFDKEATLPSSR